MPGLSNGVNMYPILFRLGGLEIYAYGVFVLLSFATGVLLVIQRARKAKVSISFERIADLFFYAVLSALLGSRILFVLINFNVYRKNPLEAFKIWEGGLVFYGGLILAAVVSIIYMKWHQLPIWKFADLSSPSIALGLFFGRIGCFFAGCCYGKETSLPWSVVFKDPNSLARLNVPLHPTQLYEAAVGIVIFFFLIWWEKRKSFDGQTFWVFTLLYSVTRFLIEMLRGDPRGFIFQDLLSTSQGIGIFLAILSLFMLSYLKRVQRTEEIEKDGRFGDS
jgi:phosphatidylglycerol---prolipoprotein diacylglyceryl transferase